MTLEQLKYFIDVAETRNMTVSASKFFISPQGLSRSLKSLQQELNTPLFVFQSGKIELTEQGMLYYAQIKDRVLQIDQINTEMSQSKTRSIKITIATYLYPLLAKILENYQATHPAVTLLILEVPDKAADQQIIDRKTDLAFLSGPVHALELKLHTLAEANDVLLLPQSHPLAQQKMVHFEEIKEEPFISMNEHYKIYDCYVQHMREMGCAPKIIFSASSLASIKPALQLKQAMTMVNPQYFLHLDGFAAIPFHQKNKWQLHAAIHRLTADPLILELFDYCQQHKNLLSFPEKD